MKAIENKPGDLNLKVDNSVRQVYDQDTGRTMFEHSFRDPEGTLSKNECINLINSDNNKNEWFGITKYKDFIILFHIFEDLYNHKLIEKGIYHKIEFIEVIDGPVKQTFIRTLSKASRTKDERVIKDISLSATRELLIALTKDVGGDFDKNALEQYKIILRVCIKPELDKHIFKIPYGRPSKNHITFTESIEHKSNTTRKFNEYLKDRIKFGLGYKNIALQPIVIPPNADDQLKRIFVWLGTLKCGNNNLNI